MSINYAQVTNISALGYAIPEIDVACFENVQIQHQLQIIPDVSYSHHVVLSVIDISANLFKKIFYDTSTTTTIFNEFTNSFTDYIFSLIPPPPTSADIMYTIPGFATQVGYYANITNYISLMPALRTKYPSGDPFYLQDELVDNIIIDMNSTYPAFLQLFNTCSFIDFNQEMTGIKTLNNIIPSSSSLMHCSLNWGNLLEIVRANHENSITDAIAILKITLVIKTTLNLTAMAVDNIVSTSEVVLRYKINFSELTQYQW